MPFGHEQREFEKRGEAAIYNEFIENKNFIEVTATMCTNGRIIPTYFRWDDRQIKIDKVLHVHDGTSLKANFMGKRFLCIAMNRRFYLYFTGKQWYVDFKT